METNVMKLLCTILAVACTTINSTGVIADGREPFFGPTAASAEGTESSLGGPVAEYTEYIESTRPEYYKIHSDSDFEPSLELETETQKLSETINKLGMEESSNYLQITYLEFSPKGLILKAKKPLPLYKMKRAKESKNKKDKPKGLYIKLELIYIPDELMRGPNGKMKEEFSGRQQVSQQAIKAVQQRNIVDQSMSRQPARRVRRVVREL